MCCLAIAPRPQQHTHHGNYQIDALTLLCPGNGSGLVFPMLLDRISMPKERTLFRPHAHMDDCHTYRGVLRMMTLAGNKSLLFVISIVRATGTSVHFFSKLENNPPSSDRWCGHESRVTRTSKTRWGISYSYNALLSHLDLEFIGTCSQAGCHKRNTAMDDSIGGS